MRPALVVAALTFAWAPPASADSKTRGAGWVATWNPDLSSGPHRADFEPTLTKILNSAFATVTSTLGVTPRKPVHVHVYGRADYAATFGEGMGQRFGGHHRGGKIHVNGGARIDKRFVGLMHHEMTHAVLNHAGRSRNVPTWLNEGLSEWFEYRAQGEHGLSPTNRMLLGNQARSAPPKLTWRGWLPRGGYIVSYAAVLFVEDTYGRSELLSFARALSNGEPFDDAAKSQLGVDKEDLVKAFGEWLRELRN